MANGDAPPRILKITYRSAINGRVARAYAKVPYGGQFDLAEKLARMVAQRQILWYRVDVAKPAEIAENRSTLQRWLGALMATTPRTKVDWLA